MPSRELTVDREVISPFADGTAQVSVALSRIPGIDVPGLLRALDKYPYGCIEQTTSRALPLLYYNDVALLGYGPADPKIADRVQDAIYRIVDMQMGDGSFGMWGPFSSPAAEWLQSYAIDFLLRARDQKMAVPAASLQRGLTWLARSADKMSPNAQAYAWYVLAKAGPRRCRPRPLLPGRQGRRDRRRPRLDAARRRAQPGRRARPRAARLRHRPPAPRSARYRATTTARGLRDRAALLALAQEAAGREGLLAVANAVRERMVAKVEYTTTQEQAWLVLAARAMAGGGELAYSVDGEAAEGDQASRSCINPDAAAIAARRARSRTRASGRSGCRSPRAACRRTRSRGGVTASASSAATTRSTARRPTSPKVRQNDRLVVSIDGLSTTDGGYHQVALLDLLPAGFEIEVGGEQGHGEELPVPAQRSPAPASPRRATTASSPPSTSAASPTTRGGRNDDELDGGYRFHVAYIVRAVTPGSFALPAAHVSDMYAPRVFGRTAMGTVTIAPR